MALPLTRTRLKGYLTLRTYRGGTGIADATIEHPSTPDSDLILVGSAQGLIINQSRETNNFRREFRGSDSDKISETYPGLPIYSITLQRVDLYDSNILEAFGILGGFNIIRQYKPLLLVADQAVPVDINGNPLQVPSLTATAGPEFKPRSYRIPGLWFNTLTQEYNIDDADQKYIAEVEMIARDIDGF